MEYIILGCLFVAGCCVVSYVLKLLLTQVKELREKANHPLVQVPSQINVNLQPLQEAIQGLPAKVLHSIQSSVNTKKGALGELIGYIELEAQYDRIIPLGTLIDFMCLKFPTATEPGHVDFIDIKTGGSARLSKEQRMLQQLIKDKKINFTKLTVNTQTNESDNETDKGSI